MGFDYINLRKIQAKLVQANYFGNNDLFQYLEKPVFLNTAEKLTEKYFHKSKDLMIFQNILELYPLYLTLAVLLQKLPYSFKLDWNRSHFLSMLRTNLSFRNNRKFVAVRTVTRNIEPERIELNLREMGVKDSPFLEVAKNLFIRNYNTFGVRGKLANCIFDPVNFLFERNGFEIRRANEFLKLEKKSFEGAIDIDLNSFEVWDYQIKRTRNKRNGKGFLEIKIRPGTIKNFKENALNIIKSNTTPQRKIILLNNLCNSFVENHKYTKDAFEQINDLKNWLNRRTSGIAATDKRVKQAVDLTKLYIEKRDVKLRFKKPNFFWNYQEYSEKSYMTFFSPYREG